MTGKHLVFYDGECGFCDHVVQFILRHDQKALFLFAPLQGETAERVLIDLPSKFRNIDSIILIENFGEKSEATYIRGKAAFRICWLLGGAFAGLGALSFLPAFLYDWGYNLVAKNRHRLFRSTECVVPKKDERERYLP